MSRKKQWAHNGRPYKKNKPEYKLLPCPWCGKVPKLQTYSLLKTRERRYGVWCDNGNDERCPMLAIETLPFKTKQEAVDAWNKRA